MKFCYLIGLSAFLMMGLDPLSSGAQPLPPSFTGDFDADGDFDCDDVNALTAEIAGGTNFPEFDMTGDGLVNGDDLDEWLAAAGAENLASGNPYLYGDANLDGLVDASDFNEWNINKFSSNSAWCSADFNADGFVDAGDFNIWNLNKFQVADSVVTLPEPSAISLLAVALIAVVRMVRRR